MVNKKVDSLCYFLFGKLKSNYIWYTTEKTISKGNCDLFKKLLSFDRYFSIRINEGPNLRLND
jgi:hypothetical protein